ncbi:OmpW/AlkL family protein [Undibacterium terreum]|uniref:Outer membrane protein W n=1 Tax=Undibacterium terreum TaxID=1224302 RepID=A0A916UT43_9BURK|nr:OmpW family outer membrane protein [Undibacterium terreum]GGC85548.1 outer membrane protein W [Undibacterium terreum]
MKKTQIAISTLLALASFSALADENFPNTVRIGYAHIAVHSDAPSLTSNGPAFLTPQPAGIKVDNANTVYIGYTRRLTANVDFDLALGIPPEHDNRGTGTLAPFGVTAKVKQRAPTMFINYNFGDESNAFRPFIGLGLNYTQFYDARSTASGNLAAGGPTKISLGDSTGWAAQIGVKYNITNRWFLMANVATADVKSPLTATTGSIERKTVINFSPIVYIVTAGYSF